MFRSRDMRFVKWIHNNWYFMLYTALTRGRHNNASVIGSATMVKVGQNKFLYLTVDLAQSLVFLTFDLAICNTAAFK